MYSLFFLQFDQLHVGALGFQLFGGTVRSRSVTASISSRWIDTEMFLNKNLSSVERLSQTTLAYFGKIVCAAAAFVVVRFSKVTNLCER